MAESLIRFAAGTVLAIIVVTIGRRQRWLTSQGAIVAAAAGAIITGAGGWWWGVLLVTFFASSSALSTFRRGATDTMTARGHERDARQVIANGGVATAIAALGVVTRGPLEPLHFALFCGAIAAVTADTWATEIGRFSRAAPRLITNGRPVARGRSGGITPLGTAGSALGGTLIGAQAALGVAAGWVTGPPPWTLLAATAVAGLVGSLLDSLLGATIQAAYVEARSGRITEWQHDAGGNLTTLVRGARWITNDIVNAAASLAGAVVAGVIWRLSG
ncbi:MAG: DUF92 domain-containing protein [Chloroflexota bacterium]|nr:DUF92 domain-containing protein [Chloroflexota bacterium]